MKEELRETAEALWQQHRGKTVGTILGIVLGIAILCFGFWCTVFVLCCGVVGLFVGSQMDQGEDILGSLSERFFQLTNHFRN